MICFLPRDQGIKTGGTRWGDGEYKGGLRISLSWRTNSRTIASKLVSFMQTSSHVCLSCCSKSYRRYILPLLPTFATVNCLPSRPAEIPSGTMPYFRSSASLFARRCTLASLRRPSCTCFFLTKSGDCAFDLGAGARAIPFLGDSSTSRTDVVMRPVFPNRPRGDRRSRCRSRKLSSGFRSAVAIDEVCSWTGAMGSSIVLVYVSLSLSLSPDSTSERVANEYPIH